MTECDLCGEETRRRKRCWHCGLFVCGYCWHHICACEPNHKKSDCEDLKRVNMLKKKYGTLVVTDYLNRLRVQSLAKVANL